MSLENLLAEGLIEAFEPTQKLVAQALESSQDDLKAGNFGWTLAMAYNSMLFISQNTQTSARMNECKAAQASMSEADDGGWAKPGAN